jgi:DNA polymerase-4
MVLDVSSQAWQGGVRKGMRLEEALRCCPEVAVVLPMPTQYQRVSERLVEELGRFSPRVELAGPGHIFADLSGTERLWGRPLDCAARLRDTIGKSLGLDVVVGVATSKLMSKVATRLIPPSGVCGVIDGCEGEVLAPLPLRLLPGLDEEELRALAQFNVTTVQQLRALKPTELNRVFGERGADIARCACGIDSSPVRMRGEAAPVVQESITMAGQTNDEEVLRRALYSLVEHAGATLRRGGLAPQRLTLWLGYSDGGRTKASMRVTAPVSGDLTLFRHAQGLLGQTLNRRVRVGEMTLLCSDLSFPYGQLDLFDAPQQEAQLMEALDRVRKKFGAGTIGFHGRSLMGVR